MFVEVHFVFHMVLETRPPKGKKCTVIKGNVIFHLDGQECLWAKY